MGGPPERTPSLEKLSPIVIARFKIKIACACYNAIDTLDLQNVCKFEKRGPFSGFHSSHHVDTWMKKNLSTDWCKHPKTSTTQKKC
jgi:hypothetical protein